MALDYSKSFYNSIRWKKLRLYICQTRNWTCEECGDYGDQVHHIIEITPDNINDSDVTLNADNLQLLCERCHNSKRKSDLDYNPDLEFDEFGNLIKSPPCLSEKNSCRNTEAPLS